MENEKNLQEPKGSEELCPDKKESIQEESASWRNLGQNDPYIQFICNHLYDDED